MTVKVTVNLSDEVARTLKSLAEASNTSVTEQVRRAISTEKWLTDIRSDEDKKVLIEDKGKIQEVIFRP